MSKEEYTIKEAAQRLGISESTVRRRVKSGELSAEKKEGPYGDQWFIPKEEINTAQTVTDVVEVDQPMSKEEVKNLISEAISETVDQALKEKFSSLEDSIKEQVKDEVENAVKEMSVNQERQSQTIKEEIEERDQKIINEIRKKQKNQTKEGFFEKLKKFLK